MTRTLVIVPLGLALATSAWALTLPQADAKACRDNTTGVVRVINPTDSCKSNETAGTMVGGTYKTAASEGWGNNDWGGRILRIGSTTRAVRILGPGLYEESVSGLALITKPTFGRMDLDDDGIDDFLYQDTVSGVLRVFYDFDDAEPATVSDADITVTKTATWDLWRDKDGVDVLTVCDGGICTDVAEMVRGEEPSKLP